MLASSSWIFLSFSILTGFGFTTTGRLTSGTAGSSSRLNQSENSDLFPKSLSSWSCIARAVFFPETHPR